MAFILIDDTHDQLVRGSKTLTNPLAWIGIGLPVPTLSQPGQGAIYWDTITQQFLHSDNGGPWKPFGLAGDKGSVTFTSTSAMSITFGVAQPDTNYFVALSSDSQEVYSISSKTTAGFNINSSNGASTATVDWILVR